MPDMDGLGLTRAVKRESPTTSVIPFTMYENADYLVEALRAGAAGYLLKGAPRERSEQVQRTQLTRREQDVLRLIALGQTNREIADTLTLTISTVKTHVEHVIGKLGVSDRTQAAVRAIELGLVGSIDDASAT